MVVVAAKGGPEADHAVHLPLAIGLLAVQGSSGVSLGKAGLCQEGPGSLGGCWEGEGLPGSLCLQYVYIVPPQAAMVSDQPLWNLTAQGGTIIPTRTNMYSFWVPGPEPSTSYSLSHGSSPKPLW